MTFYEALTEFDLDDFARYGGMFFESKICEKDLIEKLEQPLPIWLEKAVNDRLKIYPKSLDGKQ